MKALSGSLLLVLLSLVVTPAIAAETAATADTQYVSVGSDRIAYRSIGIGSPLLLLTRMRGTLDTWDPLFLDSLARNNRVITVDYPGIGYSSGQLPSDIGKAADFVLDFTRAIKLDRFALLGWSWGGFVSQTFMVEHPGIATHVILVGTNPPGKDQLPIEQVFVERALKPVNDLADEEVLFFEPRSAVSRKAARESRGRIYARPGVVSRIPSTPEVIQAYIDAHAVFRDDEKGRLQKMMQSRTPVLIVCGDRDISNPVENWFALNGKLPNAHLVVYPESGHGPQHQYPELTALLVAGFLAKSVQ